MEVDHVVLHNVLSTTLQESSIEIKSCKVVAKKTKKHVKTSIIGEFMLDNNTICFEITKTNIITSNKSGR